MPSFLRFAIFTAALLAVTTTGRTQGLAPRAQAVPQPSGYPGTGYPAPGGYPATGVPMMQQERMSVVDPNARSQWPGPRDPG